MSKEHIQLPWSHDNQQDALELVEALANCVNQIEYLHGKFTETGSGNGVLAQARALIAKHRCDAQ